MKQADIWLKVDKVGSNIPIKGVTPAEVLYLVADNHANVGGDPIESLTVTGDAMVHTGEEKDGKPVTRLRKDDEELMRLRLKYPARNIGRIFGSGYAPKFPEDFEQARKAGVGMMIPAGNLIDHKLQF